MHYVVIFSLVLLLLQVKAFCDVDEKKITKGVYIYEESKVNEYYEKKNYILCILLL